MSVRHAFFTGLAALHLFLVACGAANVSLMPTDSTAWKWFRLYGEMSGCDNQYGFFAPVVGFQTRTLFTYTDAEGNTWEEIHERGATNESNQRLGGLTDTAWRGEEPDLWQVHSWAASALGRHPTAVRVHLSIMAYHMPSMWEYRMGRRPEWVPFYQTDFIRVDQEDDPDIEGDVATPETPAVAPARKVP